MNFFLKICIILSIIVAIISLLIVGLIPLTIYEICTDKPLTIEKPIFINESNNNDDNKSSYDSNYDLMNTTNQQILGIP